MTQINIQVLRSSSAGNCTAVWHGNSAIFIDAGVTRKILDEFVLEKRIVPRALLVTHAHADHLTNPAVNFFKEHNAPIYFGSNEIVKTFSKYLPAIRKPPLLREIFNGEFIIDDITVSPFPLEHDSIGGCFGFLLRWKGVNIVVATDVVNVSAAQLPFFRDADVIVIESNHDTDMLLKSNRPLHLKNRIMEKGHLSNKKSAAFIRTVLEADSVSKRQRHRHIYLAHISHECNTHEKALKEHMEILLPVCGDNTTIRMTYRDRSSDVVSISLA